nr:hypothetical protein Clen_496 [Cedratvirus lena]
MEDCCLCSNKIILRRDVWARCLSSTCFFTDDWQSCKFRKDLPLKKDGLICRSCLDKYKHDEVLVTCDLCSNKYESIYGEYHGWYCSSSVREDCIIGEYGSTEYDLYRVWFVSKRPKHIKLGSTVCDDCISLLIYKGVCKQPMDEDRL